MLFTTAQQRKERLDICMACPVYVAKSSSCGKFMDLFQDLVTIDGVTFKPCGCHLRAKASLKHFDCPAGKWPTIFSKKQLSILKDIAERATKQKFIVKEDRDMLNQIFQTEDPNFRGFSCSSCGSQIFTTLDQLMQDMHNGTVVVDSPQVTPQIFLQGSRGVEKRRSEIY